MIIRLDLELSVIFNILDPIIYWIPSFIGSHHLLDPIIFWIPSFIGSHHLLDPIIYWIPSFFGSHHLLDPIIYWIPSFFGSHHLLWGYMIYRHLNRLAEINNFIRYFRCKIQDCLWEQYVFECVIDAQQAHTI
jgi:hypothetical protein